MYNLSGLKLQLGKSDEAHQINGETITLNPKIAESYLAAGLSLQITQTNRKS